MNDQTTNSPSLVVFGPSHWCHYCDKEISAHEHATAQQLKVVVRNHDTNATQIEMPRICKNGHPIDSNPGKETVSLVTLDGRQTVLVKAGQGVEQNKKHSSQTRYVTSLHAEN